MVRSEPVTRRDFTLSLLLARRDTAALDRMQQVMGPLPKLDRRLPQVRIVGEQRDGSFIRRRIDYEAEPGDFVPAYLLLPDRPNKRAMLCLHQTVKIGKGEPVGLGGKPNLRYAAELAARGYTCLAPDYPNFGDYVIDPYARGYASATMKGIVNHIRAVDLLAQHARRIGVIGHSLGGHNALFAAAFDPRLRATVTSCGFTSFAKYYGGNLTGWTHKGYMPRIATHYAKSPARMPFDFTDVLSAIAPRAVFINAPLHDANFEVSGVRDTVAKVQNKFKPERLIAVHPYCAHDFPPDVREQAYAALDRWLS